MGRKKDGPYASGVGSVSVVCIGGVCGPTQRVNIYWVKRESREPAVRSLVEMIHKLLLLFQQFLQLWVQPLFDHGLAAAVGLLLCILLALIVLFAVPKHGDVVKLG
jgi:hypothetical protein